MSLVIGKYNPVGPKLEKLERPIWKEKLEIGDVFYIAHSCLAVVQIGDVMRVTSIAGQWADKFGFTFYQTIDGEWQEVKPERRAGS